MSLVVASFASAVIVLISPFMGQLQGFLRRSLTTRQYVLLFGVGVLVAVGAAIIVAVTRIRERRLARFGLLLAAMAFGGSYMWATSTPYPEVNAVERVHFVEYGLIAFLFYRASRSAGDVTAIVLPLLAAFVVGTLDEWLQWFIPVRVGEAHDVFLNLASITCGLMFALALLPPPAFAMRTGRRGTTRMAIAAAGAWLVFAAFVSQVHLGFANTVEGIGTFHSHYTPAMLDTLQAERTARWQANPPARLRRLSQEDQYLDEGLWHVRRRNLTGGADAWGENLILERFFTPVLDIPTYASPEGNRWSPEQRADMAARLDPAAGAFVSGAEPYPIVAWNQARFWTVVLLVAAALVAPAVVLRKSWRDLA